MFTKERFLEKQLVPFISQFIRADIIVSQETGNITFNFLILPYEVITTFPTSSAGYKGAKAWCAILCFL